MTATVGQRGKNVNASTEQNIGKTEMSGQG